MPVSTRKTTRSQSPPSTPTSPTPAPKQLALAKSLPSASSLSSSLSSANGYQVATPFLVILACGQVGGGLLYPYDYGMAGNAALVAMQTAKFDFFGSRCSFYGFYMGFGVIYATFLLLSIGISWGLSRLPPKSASSKSKFSRADEFVWHVKWMVFLAHMVNMIVCFASFFAGPMFFSSVVAGSLGWECYKAL